MLKFRPSNLAQKRNVSFNEVQLIALIEKGLSDNSLRGFLYKRSSSSTKWRMKWFLLFENLLFYFDLSPSQQLAGGKSPTKGLSSLIRRQSNRGREERPRPPSAPNGPCEQGPRRASASEELGRRLACGPRPEAPPADPAGERPRARQRLSSDPQKLSTLSALDTLSLDYEHATSKTLHSSSISGVSSHFLSHNEQTIGRSTTTAGKTANSANYSSLLSRKIGVIFLEGSYCEKLIHSPANFALNADSDAKKEECQSEFDCIFTLTWRKEGSKEYQFRTESEAECLTWVHAISSARYSTLLEEKEQLEQKYLHLSQIVESESTAKWQYSKQCEELSAEIKKLRQEICELKRQESRSNHLRLVLSKSAAIVESIVRQQRRRARQRQQQRLELDGALSEETEELEESGPGLERPSSAEPSALRLAGQRAAASALKRARSMDQEQAEQELAVRRTARHSHLQRASADSRRSEAERLSLLVRSASVRTPSQKPPSESLDVELDSVVEALNKGMMLSGLKFEVENSEELRKIKKVQGFFRGWLCRRRWKQIVQEYIKSPHAESMRKRNNLVFRMVECEEEYVEQLTQLISAFLRPIKMAASSQRPPLSHDELNSIFLNSETLLFLHQIFLKGLTARMESWPTLVLADLFNMLLPMLTIYQEYVRNHHFSLQVLAECKQRLQFGQILRRLEEKTQLNGRTLETFLTYPMHQIPRYIICLHEILAHTPHNHVERKSLYEAQTKLEELSQQMHDEVSETENIRQNLAIERMIIGGCDILLDVNQVFVRQGILLQVLGEPGKPQRPRSRLASFASREPRRAADCQTQPHLSSAHHSNQNCDNQSRELVRQCFLFTNHLLLCTRTNDGKLHLLESGGRVELTEVTLIENPLEFIQQQEIMAAESTTTAPPTATTTTTTSNRSRTKNSSCNSIWDYHSGPCAEAKRASTASEPSKWPHGARPERPHVEFQEPRASSVFSVACAEAPERGRGRIAGYLATKLSSLANLGASSQPQSASAPPSPLNKRQPEPTRERRSTLVQLEPHKDYQGCDFILLLDSNSRGAANGQHLPLLLHLVAPNLQEKAAWMSDISQCIDNVHFNDIFHGSVNDTSNVAMNQSVRNDPRLYKDDVDIKFSRALNSCKLPQIRYASKERLFERLTDLRFLSIDFLNTFLLTYRVFTTAEDVLEALKSVHYNCDRYYQQQLCRESFSAFAYSSLSSLNNSTQTVDAANRNQPLAGQKAEAAPKAPSPSPAAVDKRKEVEQQQQRPTVPPRSLAKEAARFVGPNDGSKFLAAPNAQHQKRRSTISALTPITGSTSSSLANLSSAHKAGLQQQVVAQTSASNPDSSSPLDRSCPSNNEDLSLSEEEERRSSQPDSTILDDQTHSSSVNQTGQSIFVGKVKANLDVPNARQVRASSLSHVPGMQLPELNKSAQGNLTSSIGSEHWRLSYKKATDSSPTFAGTNLLSASKGNSTRRASSSDANVTFHVTLVPPPVETKVSDDESSRSCCPIVPPSSPIEPLSDAQPTTLASASRLKLGLDNSSLKHQRTMQNESKVQSKAGVSLTSRTLDINFGKKRHHRRRRHHRDKSDSSLAASDSTSSLSSSSVSTRSVLSSQSESGLIQSTSSEESAESDLSSRLKRTNLRDDTPVRSSSRRKQSLPVIVKEIELTESKALDCDTSADEDKVSTSSGEENNNDSDSDDQEYDFENEDDESFRILTRLNSIKISKNETECEDSCTDIDSEARNSQRASPTAKSKVEGSDCAHQQLKATKKRRNIVEKDARVGRPSKSKPEREMESEGFVEPVDTYSAPLTAKCSSVPKPTTPMATHKPESDEIKRQGAESKIEDSRSDMTDTSRLNNQRRSSQTNSLIKSCGGESGRVSQRSWNSTVGLQSNDPNSRMTTPRSSFQYHTADAVADRISKAGVIVTSSSPRVSSRRSSTASAASAFAAATAASNNPILTQPPQSLRTSNTSTPRKLSSDLLQRNNFDPSAQIDTIPCLCFNFQRHSLSAQSSNQTAGSGQLSRPQTRPSDPNNQRGPTATTPGGSQQQSFVAHHPSCIYFQPLASASPSNTPSNYYPNLSDASSVCNSRASSRLSSCAGLDYNTYTAQSNFCTIQQQNSQLHQQQQQQQQQQQHQIGSSSNQIGSPVHARSSIQSARGYTNNNQQSSRSGTYLDNRTVPVNNFKRNSSQINIRSVATIRVLSVLRHWVSKHSQDFVNDTKLSYLVQDFIQDLIMDPNLLPAEHKAAIQLQQMVQKANQLRGNRVDLDVLLSSPSKVSPDSIESLSALEVAETMTYLDHKIFLAIRSEEFLGQAWMKMDKAIKAPHILLITKRFNDVSRLVSSEIIRVPELSRRVAIIEKWANVAHICRVVHNFNGVLQICAAFTNSAVFRLKKTWDKIPKTTKTTIDQLQSLVSTDSRFRNMRDAINRCDPPSIPYVGMYLTDLSFIEEGTPNYSPDGLLNFSKMRMIAHVIREIQHLQNGSYKIELNHRVANYLLDSSRHLQDDEMYRCSLAIEPRSTGGKNGVQLLNNATNQPTGQVPSSAPSSMRPMASKN